MVKILCVFLCVCVTLQTALCQSGTSCPRPDGEVGNCIVFQNCDYYVDILSELGKDEAADILRKSFCGYEGKRPKVCCPNIECPSLTTAANNTKDGSPGTPCKTLDDEVGSCVVFQNCDYYVTTLLELGKEKAANMLRKAHCGYEGKRPKVCCPNVQCSSPTLNKNNNRGISTSEEEDYMPEFLDPPVCGNSTAKLNKVVGGEPAKLDDFPWMALLGYDTRDGLKWLCGGSLISQRHVLTAGHCIYNRQKILSVVRLGELDYAREDDGANPIDFKIKRMIIHEDFDPNYTTNDIGLLVLKGDVTFTKSIHPICIPKGKWRNETFEKYNPFIAGWGLTSNRGTSATHLQYLQLPVRRNKDCVEAFRSFKGRVFDQRVMCVGTLKGGKDACDGDSGGPLMQPINLNYYVTGVVSYGLQCAQPRFPSIFTRVTYYLPWLERKVLGRATG